MKDNFESKLKDGTKLSQKHIGGFFAWFRAFVQSKPNAIVMYLTIATIDRIISQTKKKLWFEMSKQLDDDEVAKQIETVLNETIEKLAVDTSVKLVDKKNHKLWTPPQKEIMS